LHNDTTAWKARNPDRRSITSAVLGFPRVIDEKAARTVAAVVALTGAIVVAATLEAGLGLCLGGRSSPA
jgi:hypothetical protein